MVSHIQYFDLWNYEPFIGPYKTPFLLKNIEKKVLLKK